MPKDHPKPNPFVAQRAERVQQLLAKFKEDPKIPFDEILNKFAFEKEISVKIARQYARMLEEAKVIIVEQKGVEYFARVLEE